MEPSEIPLKPLNGDHQIYFKNYVIKVEIKYCRNLKNFVILNLFMKTKDPKLQLKIKLWT